jgi:hypothetical protein
LPSASKAPAKALAKTSGLLRGQVEEHADLTQVILGAGRSHAAASAHDGHGLAGEEGVVGFPGGPVQDVLEGRRHGIVVLGARQYQGVRGGQLGQHAADRRGFFGDVGVIEGDVAKLGDFHADAFRQAGLRRSQQTPVGGFLAQAAGDAEELDGHGVFLFCGVGKVSAGHNIETRISLIGRHGCRLAPGALNSPHRRQ